ncbi:response regulator [Sphingomonas sp. TDK1]|uniref:response regulator n=1 Tax=Sphingomonas sp. TDK1 TaxID=453247 RepID=UPI0007D94EE1|nr:response regulator [Sphingomonas sp. TDK1]OAN66537.1 hypothetical protein A7X12_10395 [Sphingomonas sp. TDK1]
MSVQSLVAVVDDDEDVRLSLEMLVDSAGHAAVLFESADALLARDDLSGFDCFISDVQMPGTDGIQLARRLRAAGWAPVILITAFASEDVERRALEAGASRFLAKPFDPDALYDELHSLLG